MLAAQQVLHPLATLTQYSYDVTKHKCDTFISLNARVSSAANSQQWLSDSIIDTEIS